MSRLFPFILLLLSNLAFAGVITGKVIKVSDGDTITLLVDKKQVKVRLAGIDAPESGQDFGKKAKEKLAKMVAGEVVKVDVSGKDRYGRSIGTVWDSQANINHHMVAAGMAWQYTKYDKTEELRLIQEAAKKAKRDLWSQAKAIPPWEFRANKEKKAVIDKTGDKAGLLYWLNTSSNTRHNSTCKFKNTKRSKLCKPDEGEACGQCGG